MLDPLVYRQDGQVTGATQSAVVEQRLQAAQGPGGPIAADPDPFHEVRAGQMELGFGNGVRGVLQEVLGIVAEDGLQRGQRGRGSGCHPGRPPMEWFALSVARIHRSDDADWDAGRDERKPGSTGSGAADRDAGRAEPKEATSTAASVPVGT